MAKKRRKPRPTETPAAPALALPGAADISLYGSESSAGWTKSDIKNATDDAVKLMQDSAILRSFVHMMIFSRQLYIIAREQIDIEMAEGWTVHNPRLVLETLIQSAQNKAVQAATMADIRESANSVIAVLDILADAERRGPEAAEAAEAAGDDTPAAGVLE